MTTVTAKLPEYRLRSAARTDALMQLDHALVLLRVIAATSDGPSVSAAAQSACEWLARVQVALEDAEVQS